MKILNFGSLNIDHVYQTDHFVQAGETLASTAYHINCGGKGLNQSIALARAGATVCHAGKIAPDGARLVELLLQNGIDSHHVLQNGSFTGHAIIQVDSSGQNCILLYGGANMEITTAEIDMVLKEYSAGDYLLVQNEISNLTYLCEQAHQIGMKIVLNPSPIKENISQIDFSRLELLVCNEVEAEHISGISDPQEILSFFKAHYPSLKLVLTLGKNGAYYQDSQQTQFCPARTVKTVDTTGAGDTFLGYFVHGFTLQQEIARILATATLAASITVQRSGAAETIPYCSELPE